MYFSLNIILATIKALTKFVQVLDQHPRGAARLIWVIVAFIGLVAALHLPALVSNMPTMV